VSEGAFLLAAASRCFPEGTVHVGVVDPGVGTARKGIAIRTARSLLVGPDNGLFSGVLALEPALEAFALENRGLMGDTVSATFHGRDVFAPAAAHLARGLPVSEFGTAVRRPEVIDLWRTEREEGAIRGQVVHVDRFGNCVTNLARDLVSEGLGTGPHTVTAGGHRFGRIVRTYGDARPGEALAYYGSLETLEIGINGGSATRQLRLVRGDAVRVLAGGAGFGRR
jgi:S-adenosylmethionine hydrolase